MENSIQNVYNKHAEQFLSHCPFQSRSGETRKELISALRTFYIGVQKNKRRIFFMKLGCIIGLNDELEHKLSDLRELGIPTCQLNNWRTENYTDENLKRVQTLCDKYQIEITALWCGWSGPVRWNFYEGQTTLGLVPAAYRYQRMKDLMKGAEFAEKLGVQDVITHCGYLPEDPTCKEYSDIVAALKYLADFYQAHHCNFLFETGQETPVTLLRTIQDIGTDNLGINLDPANLILYGKGNPVDALDVFGSYVRGVHGKDGLYPTDGKHLGKETPLGQGKVNYPAFIARLKEIGYDGAITIEREISGEQQKKDIEAACKMLTRLFQA